MVRELVGADEFIEIFVDTPIEECKRRDPKGLYARAAEGKIKNFTGIDSPYEAPESPEIVVDTSKAPPEEAAQRVVLRELARTRRRPCAESAFPLSRPLRLNYGSRPATWSAIASEAVEAGRLDTEQVHHAWHTVRLGAVDAKVRRGCARRGDLRPDSCVRGLECAVRQAGQ